MAAKEIIKRDAQAGKPAAEAASGTMSALQAVLKFAQTTKDIFNQKSGNAIAEAAMTIGAMVLDVAEDAIKVQMMQQKQIEAQQKEIAALTAAVKNLKGPSMN